MSSTVAVVKLNGYRRDERGIWRYELTSKTVPGARDVTMGEYWRFRPEADGNVHIPLLCIELSATLSWARHAEQAPTRAIWRGLSLPAVRVSAGEWADRVDEVVSMTAPELAPHLLVDVGMLATMLGISTSTVRTYVTRGYLPPPTIEGLSFPVWSVPQLVATLSTRRGQGRARTAKGPRYTSSRSRTARPALSIDELDAVLAQLGVDDADDWPEDQIEDDNHGDN